MAQAIAADTVSGRDAPGAPVDPAQADRLWRIFLGVSRLLNAVNRFESACCGVTVGQCLTLTTLREQGDLTSQQLGDMLGLAPSTVTRAVAPLQDKGWLIKRRDDEDRRQWWLSLTDTGADLADQLAKRAAASYGLVLQNLPEDKRDDTLTALELLLAACRDTQSICCPTSAIPAAITEPGVSNTPMEIRHV